MPGRINVGVVGYGFAGRGFHSYLIRRVPELNLYAVASRDEARRAQAVKDYGVRVFATLDEMLDDKAVQLVVIATPHNTHEALCVQAMDAGRHVVTDKIMCLTTAEADRMIAAAKKNKVFLGVFHNRRWDGDFLTIKKVIDEGLLGRVFQIESCVGSYGSPRRGWRGVKELAGGHLYDWGAHMVDHALLFCGGAAKAKVESVYATSEFRKWDITVESHVRAQINFKDTGGCTGGLRFIIEVSRLCRIPKPRWFVLGEEGALVKEGLEPQERFMLAGNIDAAKDEPQNYARVKTTVSGVETQMTIETMKGDWTAYYRNVADVLLRGAKAAVTAEEAREVVRVVTAAMKSVETGNSIYLK